MRALLILCAEGRSEHALRGGIDGCVDEIFAVPASRERRDKSNLHPQGLMLEGQRKSLHPMAKRFGIDHQQPRDRTRRERTAARGWLQVNVCRADLRHSDADVADMLKRRSFSIGGAARGDPHCLGTHCQRAGAEPNPLARCRWLGQSHQPRRRTTASARPPTPSLPPASGRKWPAASTPRNPG